MDAGAPFFHCWLIFYLWDKGNFSLLPSTKGKEEIRFWVSELPLPSRKSIL
jgi:hypothetical protein